jgi:hypothetical protein
MMTILITQEHIIWLLLVIIAFIIGFILGTNKLSYSGVTNSEPVSFFTKNKEQEKKQQIKIDDSKFVTEIDTRLMEKKFNSLGETTVSDENVDESINKLKNLKR